MGTVFQQPADLSGESPVWRDQADATQFAELL
jgi:hypothetical protein